MMGLLNWFLGSGAAPDAAPVTAAPQPVRAHGGMAFAGLNDPALYEFMRTGQTGSARTALRNTAVFRSVDLISSIIAALPFRPMRKTAQGRMVEAEDHPLYEVLRWQANHYQTAHEFKQLMQLRVLVDGNAYARIVRVGKRVAGLLPLDGVTAELRDGDMRYRIKGEVIAPGDVLHLRGLSDDGVLGLSRVRLACRALGLSQDAEEMVIQIFRNGMAVGGNLSHPGKLSPEAYGRLKSSMEERLAGPENAGKWIITEEGMSASPFAQTASDSQNLETRQFQIEEIARVFGVPRPLMMMDDTSWGSGIEQLGILFVVFTLAPHFSTWEQAVRRSLLDRSDRATITLDFDERELLRGSMKDQAEVLARSLGGSSGPGWQEVNEVRDLLGLGAHPDGTGLTKFSQKDKANAPDKAP